MLGLTSEAQIKFMRILARKGYSAEQLFDILNAYEELVKTIEQKG